MAVNLLYFLIVLLFFKLFAFVLLLLHHLLNLLQLLRVQLISQLLGYCHQIWRNQVFFILLEFFLVLIFVVIVVQLVIVLLLVFCNDFSNFAVYFIIYLFLILLVVRGLLLIVAVRFMCILRLLCLVWRAFSLAWINLFSSGNCIVNVERDFIVFALVVAKALKFSFLVVFMLSLELLPSVVSLTNIAFTVALHELIELLIVEFTLVAIAILDININIFVV